MNDIAKGFVKLIAIIIMLFPVFLLGAFQLGPSIDRDYVPELRSHAFKLCSTNGGLKKATLDTEDFKVYCLNDATFTGKIKDIQRK